MTKGEAVVSRRPPLTADVSPKDMNKEYLKKIVGHQVRLRPIARRRSAEELPRIDDYWVVQSADDKRIQLSNVRTGHVAILGTDHVHSYLSDPAQDAVDIRRGFVWLRVQLTLRNGDLEIEPLPPGEWGQSTTGGAVKSRIFGEGPARARLSLVARVLEPTKPRIVVGIRNETGSPPARAPYLSFKLPPGFALSLYGLDGNGNDGLPRRPQPGRDSQEPKFAGDANVIVHPGTTYDVTRIEIRSPGHDSRSATIEYEVAAENADLRRGTVDVEW